MSTPDLEYSVRFQERRTLALHVLGGGRIEVRAPHGVPHAEIHEFVRERSSWLVATRERIERRERWQRASRGLEPEILFLGEVQRLQLLQGRHGVVQDGSVLRLYLPDPSDLPARARLLQRWFRERAGQVFAERLRIMAGRFGERLYGGATPPLRLRRMRRRWGSCSARGVITLNTELIRFEPGCIDYVLAHELCHLFEFNHGARFRALLDGVMPDWRHWERRLAQW